MVTRLAGNGSPIHISQAAGSAGQAARVKITGTVGGRELKQHGHRH
ncbi:hypothetical protein [Streptomyces sp. NPDC002676]